jgi:hypothetical protein
MVANSCNSRYSGSGDQEDHGSRPTHAKKLAKPSIPINKPGMVIHTCDLNYRRIAV